MRTPLILLKAIGRAVLNFVGGGLLGDIVFEALPEIANNVWDEWSKEKTVAERRAELEAVARATGEELRAGIEEIVQEIAPGDPADVRQAERLLAAGAGHDPPGTPPSRRPDRYDDPARPGAAQG